MDPLEAKRIAGREYYQRHKEKILQRHKKYNRSPKGIEWKKANRKAYHEKHKDEIKRKNKEWYEANKPRHRAAVKKWVALNKDKMLASRQKWINNNPQKQIIAAARARARVQGVPFNLTVDDIVIPSFCPVLGTPLVWDRWPKNKREKQNVPSLDRMIPKLGYVKGNVRVISWRANWIKNDGTLEEFEKLVRYMRHAALACDEDIYSIPIANPLAWSFGN